MIIKSNMFTEEEQARTEDEAIRFYNATFGRGPEHIMSCLLTYNAVYLSAMMEKLSDQLEEIYLILEAIPETAELLDQATQTSECNRSLLHSVDHTAM